MLRRLIRWFIFGPAPEETARKAAEYDDIDDPLDPQPRVRSAGPPKEEFGAPFQKWITEGKLATGEEFDVLTREDPTVIRRAASGVTADDLRKAESTPWDRLLVGFEPHPESRGFSVEIKTGDVFVDAEGTEVARAIVDAEGKLSQVVFIGSHAYVTVEWLGGDAIGRRVARLKKAPWVSAAASLRTHSEMTVLAGLLAQIDMDVKSGRLPEGYANILREALDPREAAYGSAAAAKFFLMHVVPSTARRTSHGE